MKNSRLHPSRRTEALLRVTHVGVSSSWIFFAILQSCNLGIFSRNCYSPPMSLYRKYRPQTFADVSGQQDVVRTLSEAVKQKKVAHAYLFAGPRGTGKTSMARILAKSVLTEGMEDPALQEQIIKGVEDGTVTDLIEIDAASNRGIDDIRSLVEKIQFSPVAAAAKVYIIDEVHMLTREAFNALLKTLEEPPPYAYFILATTELQKVPATIQSRCQRFTFRQIADEDIVRRLQYIAGEESIAVEPPAVQAIARAAQGGLRDAISLLDQLRSLPAITAQDVQQRVGGIGFEHVTRVLDAIASGNRETLIRSIETLDEAGVSLESFARELLAELRRMLHRAVEQRQPIDGIVRLIDLVLQAVKDLRFSPVPALALEAALLQASGQRSAGSGQESASAEALGKEIQPAKQESEIRRQKAEAPPASAVPAAPAQKSHEPATNNQSADEPINLSFEALLDKWPDIVNQTTPSSAKMSLKNGRLVAIRGDKVVISFPSGFHRDRVAQHDASSSVEGLLRQVFHHPFRIECVLDEDLSKAPPPNDDLVNLAEAAADVF